MATENKPPEETGKGDKNPLPIAEPVPAQTTVEPITPVVPAASQDELPAPPPTQPQPIEKPAPIPEPLLIRLVDEASTFEQRTIRLGWFGIILGFLSFLAAVTAGFLVYHQWKEMNAQTGFMNRAAIQARKDSADSSAATAKQLTLLQDQMTQQRQALEVDQRPWLKFELGGMVPPGTDPNATKVRTLPPFASGHPLEIPVRITNIGKTTAERIRGGLMIEIVSDDSQPIIPTHRMIFTLPGEPKVPGKRAPGQFVYEGTLYPGEVSEHTFNRVTIDGREDPITQPEIYAINAGTSHIYLVGQVWYYDIFGGIHWTRFCENSFPTKAFLPNDKQLAGILRCSHFAAIDHNQQ